MKSSLFLITFVLFAFSVNTHEIKGIVKIPDINAVNIFDLHYIPLPKDYQYYRIEGSNKLLVILSEEQIKEKKLK